MRGDAGLRLRMVDPRALAVVTTREIAAATIETSTTSSSRDSLRQ